MLLGSCMILIKVFTICTNLYLFRRSFNEMQQCPQKKYTAVSRQSISGICITFFYFLLFFGIQTLRERNFNYDNLLCSLKSGRLYRPVFPERGSTARNQEKWPVREACQRTCAREPTPNDTKCTRPSPSDFQSLEMTQLPAESLVQVGACMKIESLIGPACKFTESRQLSHLQTHRKQRIVFFWPSWKD